VILIYGYMHMKHLSVPMHPFMVWYRSTRTLIQNLYDYFTIAGGGFARDSFHPLLKELGGEWCLTCVRASMRACV
jgi:hypothetical protein